VRRESYIIILLVVTTVPS